MKNKGITLISLVIAIIIILILARITIVHLTGNGLFEKSKLAEKRVKYTNAKEIINMKLMEIQLDCEEKRVEYNLVKIAEGMKQAEEITIEKYYNKEMSLIKQGITENIINLEGIVVSVNQYLKYKFLIGESCKIIGVLEELSDTTRKEDFINIQEFERNMLQQESDLILNTKITFEPNEYTNKESEQILVKISNSKGIKSIKCLDNDTIHTQKNQTEVGIDYTVSKNGNYSFVVIDSEGKEETLNMKINIFDRISPKDFRPVEVKNYSNSVIIKGSGEDGDETEESSKSGIAKYEYFVNGIKWGETEEEEFEITNLATNVEYTIYLIAYDKVGNIKKSEEIKVTPTPKLYIYNLQDLKDFRDDVNKGYNYNGNTINLMADIDLGGKAEKPSTWWIPIGLTLREFRGMFEGNGHKVSNMYINSVNDSRYSSTQIRIFWKCDVLQRIRY